MRRSRVMFAGAAVVAAGLGVGGVATAHNSHEHFHVNLSGAAEVPGPGDPDGRATANLDIDTASGEICWSLHFSRIATPTMAHIHGTATTTTTAPVVVLFFDATKPVDPDMLERGKADGCTTASPTLASNIAAHPQDYYVNIHNARFPAGAVRGQIS